MKQIIAFLFTIFLIVSCSDNSGTLNNGSTGKIKGIVVDVNGKFIPDVSISTSPASSTVMTDAFGEFQISNVPVGTFILTVSKTGYYTFMQNVKVAGGYSSNVNITLLIQSQTNQAPVKPYNPLPADNGTITTLPINLSWNCSDPDGDALTYDIYFGETNPPVDKKAANLSGSSLSVSNLTGNKTYFWRVVAKDGLGGVTQGDVWQFKTNFATSSDTGLVLYYKFDGNAVATVGYDGTNNGVTWTTDRKGNPGKAAYFVSGINYIETIQPNVFSIKYDMTIALWFKPELSNCRNFESHIDIFNFVEKTGANTYKWYGFALNTSLGLEFWSSGSSFIINDNNILKDGEWNHIAFVYRRTASDGELGWASLYVNGQKIGDPKQIIPGYCNPDRIWIGERPDHQSSFGGAMDDVYLFKRALSEQELLDLAK